MSAIALPWPPASLSGHTGGHWRAKSTPTKKHRDWARVAAIAAKVPPQPPGDIPIKVAFYPPNNRGDRTNFGNRMKPYYDGIADAMKVNDSRFVPTYEYHPPVKGGQVIVTVGAA